MCTCTLLCVCACSLSNRFLVIWQLNGNCHHHWDTHTALPATLISVPTLSPLHLSCAASPPFLSHSGRLWSPAALRKHQKVLKRFSHLSFRRSFSLPSSTSNKTERKAKRAFSKRPFPPYRFSGEICVAVTAVLFYFANRDASSVWKVSSQFCIFLLLLELDEYVPLFHLVYSKLRKYK